MTTGTSEPGGYPNIYGPELDELVDAHASLLGARLTLIDLSHDKRGTVPASDGAFLAWKREVRDAEAWRDRAQRELDELGGRG